MDVVPHGGKHIVKAPAAYRDVYRRACGAPPGIRPRGATLRGYPVIHGSERAAWAPTPDLVAAFLEVDTIIQRRPRMLIRPLPGISLGAVRLRGSDGSGGVLG